MVHWLLCQFLQLWKLFIFVTDLTANPNCMTHEIWVSGKLIYQDFMREQFGDGILNIPESVCIKLNQMDRNQNPLECDYFIQIIHTEIRSHDSRDIVRSYKNDHVLNTWRFNLKILSFVLELNHLGNHSMKNSFFLLVLFCVPEKFIGGKSIHMLDQGSPDGH